MLHALLSRMKLILRGSELARSQPHSVVVCNEIGGAVLIDSDTRPSTHDADPSDTVTSGVRERLGEVVFLPHIGQGG